MAVRRAGWSLVFAFALWLLALCGVSPADLQRIADAKVRRIKRDDARARGVKVIAVLCAAWLASCAPAMADPAAVVAILPARALAPCPAGTTFLYVDHLHAQRVCGRVMP